MSTTSVKRAYRYRFYPSDAQAAELARTFRCVRNIYNLALAARGQAWTDRREQVGYAATSALLTGWQRTGELACGAVHDRDVNAARNLLAAGPAVAACGDNVGPQRNPPGGQSSVKQEAVPPQRTRGLPGAAAQPRG